MDQTTFWNFSKVSKSSAACRKDLFDRLSGSPKGVRLLACAALAAVFTVSAMAAYHLWGPGELFDPFFTLESAPLDDGQKELLDQIGATNLPPVTSNGVTLTRGEANRCLAAFADYIEAN